MHKIRNIEKKFCLLSVFIGLILPLTNQTEVSLWTFGLVSGLGFAGWLLLPDKNNEEKGED